MEPYSETASDSLPTPPARTRRSVPFVLIRALRAGAFRSVPFRAVPVSGHALTHRHDEQLRRDGTELCSDPSERSTVATAHNFVPIQLDGSTRKSQVRAVSISGSRALLFADTTSPDPSTGYPWVFCFWQVSAPLRIRCSSFPGRQVGLPRVGSDQ